MKTEGPFPLFHSDGAGTIRKDLEDQGVYESEKPAIAERHCLLR